MVATLHHLSVPAPILSRSFWLYVWEVVLPTGCKTYYVGMTGDTGSGRAQSAMNRVSAHLGKNFKSNALRRYLEKKRTVELENCKGLEFFAFGPVYAKPSDEEYPTVRRQVAALEKRLWQRMNAAGYDMLNKEPTGIGEVDERRWVGVCAAFQQQFDRLAADQK
jgi:hypothetical protein